jgi:alpha-N-arabinofuranosidase
VNLVGGWKEDDMKRFWLRAVVVGGCGLTMLVGARGQDTAKLTVDTTQVVSAVSPMLYGLMTEEINHAFEGGLYAEMVKNNTFRGVEGWGEVVNGGAEMSMSVDKTQGPSQALPTSLKLVVETASAGNEAGVSNGGFWGMAVAGHTTYKGSLYARTDAPSEMKATAKGARPGSAAATAALAASTAVLLRVQLVADDTGAVVSKADVHVAGGGWKRYPFTLSTFDMKASAHHHLEVLMSAPGTVWLQRISLMGPTMNNRPNGTRPDLMALMAAMHPHFLRLPGGNYLEGDMLADRYDFKKTIGPLVDRPGHQGPWGYWSTDGFGLLEMLEWCEDLHIEPVLAVYAGYSLRHVYFEPGAELAPFVQDALDEVQYATGDVSTTWGAKRARDGHPAPFALHYIEVGNEDQFDRSGSYDARFAQFAKALHARYPQYKVIATTPVKETEAGAQPDVIDDHYYKSPAEMFELVHKYDDAPRTGPKVFVGEWATRSASPTPDFGDALGDAAFMTSLERNGDLIVMASYAPLLTNVNPGAMQWATDLIGYDAMKSYGSPSYYAQCMFGAHVGDGTVKSSISGAGDRFFYSATVSTGDNVLHLKLVNASSVAQPLAIELAGVEGGVGNVVSLHAASFAATNSLAEPEKIKPVESTVPVRERFAHTVPAFTIEVIDVVLK